LKLGKRLIPTLIKRAFQTAVKPITQSLGCTNAYLRCGLLSYKKTTTDNIDTIAERIEEAFKIKYVGNIFLFKIAEYPGRV
jgi:hypothetical protein